MNQLIAIGNNSVGGATIQTVNARELHHFLENKDHFATWVKSRIKQYGFVENQDFVIYSENSEKGRPSEEYSISLDMGKELAMVERTAKGKQARQYFIECERQAKIQAVNPSPEIQIAQAMLLAGKMIEEQKIMITEMKPKADFFDAVTGSPTAIDMALAAKTLNMGIGRNNLFEFLRNAGILDRHNIPYQKYCDAGYFRVIESPYTKPDGTVCISFKSVVYQKGLDYIRRRLADDTTKRAA